MKQIIVIVIVAFFITLGFWKADISKDQTNIVRVAGKVEAYNDWECGYSKRPDCEVVFELNENTEHRVRRIRFGKDFMAIKVKKQNKNGWIMLGKGIEIIEQTGT